MMKKLSFDTSTIIDLAEGSRRFFRYVDNMLNSFLNSNYKSVISTKVQGESINRLQEHPFNYSENDAIQKVKSIISRLRLKREFFDKDVDKRNGLLLSEKYGIDVCHPPDNFIIAHLKRIGVSLVITRDKNFKKVAEGEGIRVIFLDPERVETRR